MAHLAQLRESLALFRAQRATVLVVGPDPAPVWRAQWSHETPPGVVVPDPARRVAGLFRQGRRLTHWLPAVFIIDRRGRVRYARYSASLRDVPLSEALLAELRRINSRGADGGQAPSVAADRRAVLTAGAAAFAAGMPEAWADYLRRGEQLGATSEEWLAAILAHVTGELAGHALAGQLLSAPWLSPEGLRRAGRTPAHALEVLAEAAGVQDRIALLVRLLEIKDPYTAGHSGRVSALAAALGADLDLTPDEVEDLAVAGLLHDVGKVAVPMHVLSKAGRLNDAEFARMRAHPAASEELIVRFTPLGRLGPVVRHHHEQWRGGGYPDNLAGAAIPLGSRILAVADAYDAMTSARAYRGAMPSDDALAIMDENARGQWEADLVAALRRVLRQGDVAIGVPDVARHRPREQEAAGPA